MSDDQDCGADDGAVEQLYDELLARAWALRSVMPTIGPDPTSAPVGAALMRAAAHHVQHVTTSVTGPMELARVLWPCGPPPPAGDPWWQTPLGQLLTGTRSDRVGSALASETCSRVAADAAARGIMVLRSGNASI